MLSIPRFFQFKSSRITPYVSLFSLLSSRYTALLLFLFAIYLLTYTPRINSSDGLAMFATAESLVRRSATDIEQIRWMGLQQGTFGLDGLLYSRKGIGAPAALLPLTWVGLATPWFGTVGVSLLFNAVITALTAVLLMVYLEALGYSQRTGLIVALTFGLATLAWPYAKSLFSDPFSGLLLLATALVLLKFRNLQMCRCAGVRGCGGEKFLSSAPPLPRPPTLFYPLLTGLFLGWNVATRYAEALFIPIFGLLLLYYAFTIYDLRFTIYDLRLILPPVLAFSAPLLLIGLGLIAFNLFRYGDPLNTGYLPNETFSGVLWEGVLGQLVSPGRGLLLYSPILLLSFWGFLPLVRRCKAEAVMALSVIIIHLLLYGKWFMWHGGYAWGPRFMIPTLPFWTIFLAPVFEQALNHHSSLVTRHSSFVIRHSSFTSYGLLRTGVLLLIILSLIPQLLGVAIDFAPFQNSLLDNGLPLFARQTFFDPQYSAFVGAWAFISQDTLDLAWAWQGQVNWGLLAMLAANIAITGYFLWKAVQPQNNPQLSIINYLPLLSTLVALTFLLAHTHALPSTQLQQSVALLNQSAQPGDAIITNDPAIAMPLAELYKGHAPILGLNNGGFPLPEDVTTRLNQTIAHHIQIWWLPNWLPPEESAIEQTLRLQTIPARQQNFNGQRLVLFVQPPTITPNPAIDVTFDNQIKLAEAFYWPTISANSALPVELHWQALRPVTDDYQVFIHLVDSQGKIIAQADGQPAQWARPTSTWAVGEIIVDRHGLWLPSEVTPGEYRLRIGLYRLVDGQRLYLPDGADKVEFIVQIG
jgi:hypothetical protein